MSREERIEKALVQPIVKCSGEVEDNGQIYVSSSALLHLLIEENKEHNDRVNARILEHLRSVIAGGNEPMFTAGPYWHYESLSLSFAVARHTPSVWNAFTAIEKDKIDLVMRCYARCSAFVSNDCNFYMTGASLSGNYSKTWNPNHRMAMVFPAIAAYLFYAADGGGNWFGYVPTKEIQAQFDECTKQTTMEGLLAGSAKLQQLCSEDTRYIPLHLPVSRTVHTSNVIGYVRPMSGAGTDFSTVKVEKR